MDKLTIILLIIIISISSCKKDEFDDVKNNNTELGNHVFSAVINGTGVKIEENSVNVFYRTGKTKASGVINDLILGFDFSIGPLIAFGDTIRNRIGIEFSNHINYNDLDENDEISEIKFRDLLKIGQYSFTYMPSKQPGVIVDYFDENGIRWISNKYFSATGNGGDTIPIIPDYTDFRFNIVESSPEEPMYEIYQWGQKLIVNFDCYLYNRNGDSLRLDNAKLAGEFFY